MAAMNPAIIGIVNYRRRPRAPNIARASCQSADCEKYMRLGQEEIAFGQCTEASPAPQFLFCFALLTLLWSETKVSDLKFGLRL